MGVGDFRVERIIAGVALGIYLYAKCGLVGMDEDHDGLVTGDRKPSPIVESR